MKRTRLLVSLAAVSLLLAACSSKPGLASKPEPRTLTIFAAASLTDAFTEIGQAFEASQPGLKVLFNFGGSQNLRTQIEQGAPADVFASANMEEMDALITGKFVRADAPQNFAGNRLIVILPAKNRAGITTFVLLFATRWLETTNEHDTH